MEPLTREDLLAPLVRAITHAPRSLQKKIGPSELGQPCARRLLHKIAGDDEPDRGPAWRPTIGTAVHAFLDPIYEVDADYITETKVSVGEVRGQEITGHMDLYHLPTGTAIDWKVVGKSRLAIYKTKGPGPQYRTQIHLYGRGMQRAGYDVKQVKIAFLPREGELKDAHIWTEDYNEEIAVNALNRYAGLCTLLETKGKDAALELFDPCTEWFCPWCGSGSPKPKRTGGSFFAPTFD